DELQQAVSIKQVLQEDTELLPLLSGICKSIERRYRQLQLGKYETLRSEYISHLYLFNIWANFTVGNEQIFAKICGVSEDGYLELETNTGLRQFGNKEIEFINQL